MAMQYDAVVSSRPGNRVERLMREKEDGKIDKTMWNQPNLRPRGMKRDQDEYGFPLGTETPSMQVICSEISASESPLLVLLWLLHRRSHLRDMVFFSVFCPQGDVEN